MALAREVDQLADTVRGDRAGQKIRDDAYNVIESRRKSPPLLEKERHRTVGDLLAPEQIQAIAKGSVLHDQSENRHEYVGLDGKEVVIQRDTAQLFLLFAEAAAEAAHDPVGFDGVKIEEGLDLEGHYFAVRFFGFGGEFALSADKILTHQQHDRRADEGQQRHDLAVMPDHKEGRYEIENRDDDGGQPGDGVFADGHHVGIEAVEQIAAGILADGHPVRVDDLVEDIRLDIVVDIDGEPGRNAVDEIREGQTESGAAEHDGDHKAELITLIAGDDIDHMFAGDARDERHGGAEHAEQDIKHDHPAIALAVGKDPAPVIQNLAEGAVMDRVAELMERAEKRTIFRRDLFHMLTASPKSIKLL